MQIWFSHAKLKRCIKYAYERRSPSKEARKDVEHHQIINVCETIFKMKRERRRLLSRDSTGRQQASNSGQHLHYVWIKEFKENVKENRKAQTLHKVTSFEA
ncbi:hypothetical protein CDL12_22623 [Handroanthus impetiginosus]|uniref:Uncharacterized protein n=1 Tax=Handroanthus impetiginosus TaxID=429701 RepID=A0A2G9GHU0_9LAMI|nr:hypothetical protein CDL12_22623 [Handroanthus impetiginosus]